MEQRFQQLIKRLIHLGYSPFERESIIKDAAGKCVFDQLTYAQRTRVIKNLEKYERLGSHYMQAYSK
jgi:hypothetical protein